MKKSIAVITVVAVLVVSGLAFAQMNDKNMMDGKSGMMGMMDGKMMGMCPMMQSMMQKQVVATNDGGIVVVAGNKITKYDKDLNVVKEIESKMDMESMQKMMEKMNSMCPMMKGMMGDMKEDSSKGSAATDSISADEHASHHPENK